MEVSFTGGRVRQAATEFSSAITTQITARIAEASESYYYRFQKALVYGKIGH